MNTKDKDSVLWAVLDFGERKIPSGEEHWCDNREEADADVITFVCVTEGEMILRDSRGDQRVLAGDLMICRHGDDSSYGAFSSEQSCSYLWVHLGGSGLADHFDLLRSRYRSILNIGRYHPMVPGIRRLCSLTDPKDLADPLVMAAATHRMVMSIFAYAEIGFDGKLTPVNQAIHHLVSAPFNPWNLKELSANCGCSREHLCREFSARYGQSPQQFLVQYRGQRALYLLQHTALSISSIASQTGFPSLASLDRQIRSMTGHTPQELRPMKVVDKPPGGKLQGLYDENKLM